MGCELLRPRVLRALNVTLECSQCDKYDTIIEVLLRSTLESFRNLDVHARTQAQDNIVRQCEGSPVNIDCQACHASLVAYVQVDLRLLEVEALSMIDLCKNESLTRLVASYSLIAPSLFDYTPLDTSHFAFRSEFGCRPQLYCEPLLSGMQEARRIFSKECKFSENGELLTPVVLYGGRIVLSSFIIPTSS